MKTLIGTAIAMVTVFFVASLVLANPAMIPKHPGYPAGNPKDPVRGQSLANDPGQTNAFGAKASMAGAAADSAHTMQNLSDPNNERLKKSMGAGLLPQVDGPKFFTTPPVKSATKMK